MNRQNRASLYHAHPLLDPGLMSNRPAIVDFWSETHHQLSRSRGDGMPPPGGAGVAIRGAVEDSPGLQAFILDADTYLDDLLRLVQPDLQDRLSVMPVTRQASEVVDRYGCTDTVGGQT